MGFGISSITKAITSPLKIVKKAAGTLSSALMPKNKVVYQKLAGIDQAKKEGFQHTNPARITMTSEEEIPLLGPADKPKDA